MLLDDMVDRNPKVGELINKKDLRFVQALIKGDLPSEDNPKSMNYNDKLTFVGWMFDIVANHTNSLDVDKLDYLQRDSRFIGI